MQLHRSQINTWNMNKVVLVKLDLGFGSSNTESDTLPNLKMGSAVARSPAHFLTGKDSFATHLSFLVAITSAQAMSCMGSSPAWDDYLLGTAWHVLHGRTAWWQCMLRRHSGKWRWYNAAFYYVLTSHQVGLGTLLYYCHLFSHFNSDLI